MKVLVGTDLGHQGAISHTKIEKKREKSTRILDEFVDDKRVKTTFVLFSGENHCYYHFGDDRGSRLSGFQLDTRRLRSLK
jgi:hypothetical protein